MTEENPLPPTPMKTIAELTQEAQALARIDGPTLQAAAACLTQAGVAHFELSSDTTLSEEARKAHRFVAMNLQHATERVLGLGWPDVSAREIIREGVLKQVLAHRERAKLLAARAQKRAGLKAPGASANAPVNTPHGKMS